MDSEGYPEAAELRKIKKWDCKDVFSLITYIENRWAYSDWGFKKYWATDSLLKRGLVLYLELHTAGWSGNEDIINALLENNMFCALWYKQWRVGGHYYFEINPVNIGYSTVQQYCKDKKCSRQNVYHQKDKFDWIEVSPNKKFLKPKNK